MRLHPVGRADPTITLEVIYAGEPAEDRELPQQAPASLEAEGFFDVQLLFVYGTDDISRVTFSDVTLVDISEDTERGYAPASSSPP